MKEKLTHVAYLTQVPGPYRERMHEIVANYRSFNYSVIYCALLEPNRTWKLDLGTYPKYFLSESAKTFRHNNFNVWKLLNRLNPDVIIITAFKPTMLYATVWCLLKRRKLIVYNDGTYVSEKGFSIVQKLIRRMVFAVSKAFLFPGKGTVELYKTYRIKENKMFKSCLCVDNKKLQYQDPSERDYHIMFSGQIIARKLPLFFAEVATRLKRELPQLKVLVVGDGDMRAEMLNVLGNAGVDYTFTGFLDQETLVSYYAKAKLFLFPTLNDPWGIVANEACASGTPVITCSQAGVADDLIVNSVNGYVLPLNEDIWATYILRLLNDDHLLRSFSENALKMVEPFNHQQAADGIVKSVEYSLETTF